MFDQSFERFSRVGILNSCSDFRLGWETALLPPEERIVTGPDEYDILNDLEVGNYIQRYYIEKEGLRIDYLSEEEGEEVEVEDTEGGDLRLSSQQDPPRCDDPPVSSSDMVEDPLTMSFADPVGSAGIIVEGVAGLETIGSRIDPIGQSLGLVTASTSHVVGVSSITAACEGTIVVTTSHTPESIAVTAPVDLLASHGGGTC